MRVLPLFVFFTLACCYEAGPVVQVILRFVAVTVGGRVAATVASAIGAAKLFGVGASGIWYGQYVIVNGALYYGSTAVAGGVLGAGAVAGSVADTIGEDDDYEAVTDPEESSSIMASIQNESKSVESVSKASEASKASAASKSASLAAVSASKKKKAQISMIVLSKVVSMAASIKSSNEEATVTAPPPPGQPVSTLPPSNRPSEVPPGVPDYNFRMCQNDMIAMGEKKQNLVFDNPSGYSLRVDNIPATCMVLSSVMHGDPALGPHPVVMGTSSLQWDNIDAEAINTIRKAFGLPPV